MEPVTNSSGKKGFYDESIGFVSLDDMQKVTNQQGQRGYYNEKTGFVAAPIQPTPEAETEKPSAGFIDKVGEALTKRQKNVTETLESAGKSKLGLVGELPGVTAQIGGQAAGFVGDVVGQSIASAAESIVPEQTQKTIKESLSELAQTKIGKAGILAIQKGAEAYRSYKERYPESAKALEGIVNLSSLGVSSKGGSTAIKESGNILSDAKALITKAMPDDTEKQISKAIKNGINKSIRPGVEGKRTFSQADRYYKQAEKAVTTIVDNKDKLSLVDESGEAVSGLPKNLQQFSQAIDQTKREIFSQYDALSSAATGKGAFVSLSPIAKELEAISKNIVLQDLAPSTVNYAKDIAKKLAKRNNYTAEQAQDAIQSLNRSLESFYKSPTYDTASKAYIDSLVANKMRESLDGIIETLHEGGYKELKNKYGALKAIERDVNRRSIVDARKNAKGLIDFTDVFTGSEVIHGLLTLNPARVGAGAAGKTISMLHKIKVDPNRYVKNMFDDVEKIITKQGIKEQPFVPKSAIGKKVI